MRATSLFLATLILAAPATADGPFADLGFDAAVAKAKAEGKLLLVDFTATWCPPCKQMEKVTWPAREVGEWIAAHALAIQVDVDEQRELSQRFDIAAIPTIVLLKDGAEVDRKTGFQDAAKLVAWGDAVRAGKSAENASPDTSSVADALGDEDVQVRLEAAHDAMRQGQDAEALDLFVSVWPRWRVGSLFVRVQLRSVLSGLARLAERHEPARATIDRLLRDLELDVFASDPPAWALFEDWLDACDAFGKNARVLAWFDQEHDEQGRLFGSRFEQRERGDLVRMRIAIEALLIEERRFEDAARLFEDPLRYAQEMGLAMRLGGVMADAMMPLLRSDARVSTDMLRGLVVARIHAVVLAAGRHAEAEALAAYAFQDDGRGLLRVALVERVLDLDIGQPAQLQTWLQEAEDLGADVTDVRARLAVPAPKGP